MVNVLHIYKDYHPILGGIENHVKMLAEAEVAAGHVVTVLVTNPGREQSRETLNGVQLIRARRLATVASTPLSLEMGVILGRLRPDITHLHFPYPVGEVSQLLFGRGRPYVITYHSDVVRQQRMLRLYRPVMKRVLGGAAQIMPTSHNYLASSAILGPYAGHCTIVPLAVEWKPFLAAQPLWSPAGMPTLLFVGRHRYYKGVDELIQAMPHVQARLIIGGDGPLRSRWEQLTKELKLGERIIFAGEVSDEALPGLFASADIFVLPANSRAEAFGKVLLEAMAAGLPCITTELGTGTSFVVQNGQTGLVVPPHQPLALAEAINQLLANQSLREAMGRSGRERVLAHFTVEKLSGRVTAIYHQALNR